MFNGLTAHSLIKNESNWIWYSLMSVIDNPDITKIMVYDTGSTDGTIEIVKSIQSPKIELKEIGNVSAEEFSGLRQEMMEQTKTNWFMILVFITLQSSLISWDLILLSAAYSCIRELSIVGAINLSSIFSFIVDKLGFSKTSANIFFNTLKLKPNCLKSSMIYPILSS